MEINLPFPRKMAGHNRAKLLHMFNHISKIAPRSARVNESNFEKIAYGGSHKRGGVPRFVLKKLN